MNDLADAIQPVVNDTVEKTKEVQSIFSSAAGYLFSYLPTIALAIIVMLIGMVATKIVLKLMQKGLKRTKIDMTVSSFFYSTAKVVLYLILFTMVLTVLGVHTTSIIAVIGTAGIAIGLALQDSLSNLAGGILILINQPFKVGDFIEVNSVSGKVRAINILYTQLDSADNKAIFIPNGIVSGGTLINHTKNDLRRVDMFFSVSYENNIKQAIKIIKAILEENKKVLAEPAPLVRVSEYTEGSVKIIAYPWCSQEDYWTVKFDVMEAVKEELDKNGILLAYNSLYRHKDRI